MAVVKGEVTLAKVKNGEDGVPGAPGQSTYTWVKYADTPTTGMSNFPEGKSYIGLAYNKTTNVESEIYSDYSWSLIKGEPGEGIPGTPGEDGKTYYTWIMYADTEFGDGISNDPDGKDFIGMAYNKETETESNNPKDYQWVLFKGPKGDEGPKGENGVPGPAGKDGNPTYTWLKYADSPTSGMSDDPTGKKYMGLAYNKTTKNESTNYSDYTWSLIKGEGIPGPAGADGKTTYTWIKYASTVSGTGMSDDPTGKLYIGMAYNKTTPTESNVASDYTWALFKGADGTDGQSVNTINTEFYLSTSKTTQTGGSWVTTPPTWSTNKYLWTRSKIVYKDPVKTEYTTPVVDSGWEAANLVLYPIVQTAQPTTGMENQQWWKTDSAGNVLGYYVWKTNKWVAQTIQQSVLNITTLNAVTITGGKITGTEIQSSKFINSGTTAASGSTTLMDYVTSIQGNIRMDWKIQNSTQNGYLNVDPSGVNAASFSDAALTTRQWYWELTNVGLVAGFGSGTTGNLVQGSFGPYGLTMSDYRYSAYGSVNLRFQDLISVGETDVTPASGFAIYSTSSANRPTATRNGRVVQLKGALKNNSALAAGWSGVLCTVPTWCRPKNPVNQLVQGSDHSIFLIIVNPNGQITMGRYRGQTGGTFGFKECGAGSWLNIACTYAAGDL